MKELRWGSRKIKASETDLLPLSIDSDTSLKNNGDGESYEPQVIEVVENTIYFYSDIDREKTLKLNKAIHTLNNDLLWKSQITKNKPADIYLHINSHGGSIFDAFSVIDTIRTSEVPVFTVIDGCTASSATLISIVGKKRYIKMHSYFLIHQLSSFMFGKYNEFQDEMENLDEFMGMIRKLYKEYTRIPIKKLNEILQHDLWFNAQQAIEYGLADEIL